MVGETKKVQKQVNVYRQSAQKGFLRRTFSSSEYDKLGETKKEKPKKRTVDDVLHVIMSSHKPDDDENGAKNILVRVDFNVPMNPDGTISDDSRIRGALPTIRHILDANCNAVLISHMGRPKKVQKNEEGCDEQRKKLSLKPVSIRLAQLLGQDVAFAPDCLGKVAKDAVAALPKDGCGVLVLENLRFYKEEEKNNAEFAKSLASLADAYVNDAFGTSHRAHASVTGIPALLPDDMCGLGCLVAAEVDYLDFDHLEPGSSVTAIIGGSKVSTKLPVIKGLLEKVDILVLGGGLAFTFLKSKGINIGDSLLEEGMIDTASELLSYAEQKGKKLVLPLDANCAKAFPDHQLKEDETELFDLTVEAGGIPDGWSGFDIGPKTLELFKSELAGSTKLVFNGPMGVFEVPPFDKGTIGLVDILEDLTKNGTITVVGGGDSVAALEAAKKSNVVSYISTGGGATLELLSGIDLPGVAAISCID